MEEGRDHLGGGEVHVGGGTFIMEEGRFMLEGELHVGRWRLMLDGGEVHVAGREVLIGMGEVHVGGGKVHDKGPVRFMLEGGGSCWRVEFILEGERIMLEGGGSHLETIKVCRWP